MKGVRQPRAARPRATRVARGSFGGQEVVAAGFVLAMVAVAAVAAWPIYASPAYLVTVGTATLGGTAIAVLAHWRGWRAGAVVAAVAGLLVVIGLTVAVPIWSVGPARAIAGFGTGLVTAWKDLVTVDLPVGGYRNLLVPALVVFAVGTLAALLLAWRHSRVHVLAVPVLLAAQWFGLGFGADAATAPVTVLGVPVAAPREAVLGALGLVLGLGMLAWRARQERAAALGRAADATGVRLVRRPTGAGARSLALALGMVTIAVGAGVVLTPLVAAGSTREVLRSATGPDLRLAAEVSPLAGYRAWFTDASYDAVLFEVGSDSGTLPDRIRLATLSSYDGEVFTVSGDAATAFRRLPYRRDAGEGEAARITVTAGDLGSLWLPVAGSLEQVQFGGQRAQELADGFYYDGTSDSAVDTVAGGLRAGDSYTLDVRLPDPVDLASLQPVGWTSDVALPESLHTWVRDQRQPQDGAGLATLVQRLRERGYLSHSLSAEPVPGWVPDLGTGYAFRASTAGHSLGRIDELFSELLDRADAVEGTEDASLVAAVGDDEQFAVSVALLAEELGFRSRVVLGARLVPGEDEAAAGVPACEDGVCRGRNMTAWAEVLGADGRWAVVDTTPQHEQPIDEAQQQQRDPENPTTVRPEQANEIAPPDPTGTKGTNESQPETDHGPGLDWLWQGLRVGGIGLSSAGILAGPFLVVLGAKSLRRRSRRAAGSASARVAGGWEEFLDTAIDHGVAVPPHRTRTEIAVDLGEGAVALATVADHAVFSGRQPSEAEAVGFWQAVDVERRALRADLSWWRRWRAKVSLASFLRYRRTEARAERRPRRSGADPR